MKRSMRFMALLVGFGVVVVGWSTAQGGTVEIRFGHGDSPDVYISKKAAASVIFKSLVEGETGGEVSVKLYPAGQVGGERELVEATKLGSVQVSMVSAAIAGYYREAQVLDIPYLFKSSAVAWRVMDGPFGKAMMDDCVKKTGLRILSYGETGFRHFIASRPIKSAADVKNMKLRVMESPIYVTMMKAFGAAPTPIPWPETYTAVQQKVVDGLELPIPPYMMAKMYEVAKYLTLDGHSYSVDFLLINEKFFQSLPARTQNIIKSAAISAAIGGRGIHQLDSALGMAKMKDLGVQVYFPTPVEMEGFKAAAQKPVMDYIAQQVGNKWVDDVLKAVKQAEAELAQY